MNTNQKSVSHSGTPQTENHPQGTGRFFSSGTHKGREIVIVENQDGDFGAIIDGRKLTQFEQPLLLYWFSTELQAVRAAQQLIEG